MSAYLCNPDHIGQLASAMSQYVLVAGKKVWHKDFAKLLANANWFGVEEKYGEKDTKWMNGGYGLEVYEAMCVEKSLETDLTLKPIDLIKMAKAFAYQACEDKVYWPTATAGSDFVGQWHIDNFIGTMITKLPGWDDAPWYYEGKADAPAVKLVG